MAPTKLIACKAYRRSSSERREARCQVERKATRGAACRNIRRSKSPGVVDSSSSEEMSPESSKSTRPIPSKASSILVKLENPSGEQPTIATLNLENEEQPIASTSAKVANTNRVESFAEEEHKKKMEILKEQLRREKAQEIRSVVEHEGKMRVLEAQEEYWKEMLAHGVQKS